MTSSLTAIGQTLASYLPQNEHTSAAERLSTGIQTLENTLNNRTGEAFKEEVAAIIETVQKEKTSCFESIQKLNGSFFEDPSSLLKQSRDRLVATVLIALDVWVQADTDLNAIKEQLNTLDADLQTTKDAKNAIETYITLENERNKHQERIETILSMENTPELQESLVIQKSALESRQIELMGHYQKDPNALLDQAWNAFKTAESNGDKEEIDLLCGKFFSLEEERKSNETKLFNLGKQLSIQTNPECSYEKLTVEDIEKRIATLKNAKADQESKAGVDWKKTAAIAAPIALAAGLLYRACRVSKR